MIIIYINRMGTTGMEKQIDNKQDETKEVKIDSNLDTREGQLDN